MPNKNQRLVEICCESLSLSDIEKIIHQDQRAQKLVICHLHHLSEELSGKMFNYIKDLGGLRSLGVEQTTLDDSMAEKIVAAVPQIESLTLGICRFVGNPVRLLLSRLQQVTYFELFQSTLDEDPEVVQKITQEFRASRNINSIRICNNFIEDQDLESLILACSEMSLKSFDLFHQRVLTESLATSMKSFRTLEYLALNNFCLYGSPQSLSDETVISIMEVIQSNPGLVLVDLREVIESKIKNPRLKTDLLQLLNQRKIEIQ
jgi:hypothetical protein